MNDQPHPTNADHTNLLTLDTIRELVHLVNQANLSELLIERDGTRLHIKREYPSAASQAPAASAMDNMTQPPAPDAPPDASATLNSMTLAVSQRPSMPTDQHSPSSPSTDDYVLKAPMVGIFCSAPEPSSSPFVAVGDIITTGDTVCLIESLQIMHPIGADIGGRIAQILVQDGQAVEYGQPLMVLTPADSL
jgi:acetyl-CoA carboxylase biotin carboxyl carrier protein